MKLFILVALSLHFLVAPQQPVHTVTVTPAFRDNSLHLTYHVPQGFVIRTEFGQAALKAKTDQTTGAQKAVAACVTVPFTAVSSSKELKTISILRMDLTCLGYSLPPAQLGALATSILTEGMTGNANPVIQPANVYKLGTHDAAIARGESESREMEKVLQSATACTFQENNVLCWQFLALDRSTLDELGAAKVQFDGEPELAIFPHS